MKDSNDQKRSKIAFWIPAVLWMGFIFFLSTDLFSAPQTGSIVQMLLKAVFPFLTQDQIYEIHIGIRKSAHVVGYATLSYFYWVGLTKSFQVTSTWNLRKAFLVIVLCAIYGATDEWHQSFSEQRTGAIGDVGWDTLGAVLFQIVLLIKKNWMGSKKATF